MSASIPTIPLSKYTQEFKDTTREKEFQNHHWKERSHQNLTVVMVWVLVVGILLIANWHQQWPLNSWLFFLIQFAGYGAVRWLSRRPQYYPSYDTFLTLTLTAMILSIVSFRLLAPDNTMVIALFIITPLIITIALNIRFYYTLLLIAIIVANYYWALYKTNLDLEFIRVLASQMLISAGIGLIIQRLINASRHHDYGSLITEQHYNAQITKAQHTAEKANQLKSLFLAQASHDIRTPMTGVLGLSRLLKKTPLNEHQLSMLQAIEASSNSLTNLMGQLLDLSRIEQGIFKLQEKSFSPEQLVDEVSRLLHPLAKDKDLTIEHSFQVPSHRLVHADEGRLRQILINLISNAIQYSNQGTISIQVKTLHDQETDAVILIFHVTDPGEGIPEKDQKEIFNSFYQSNTTQNPYGLGLGLFISHELAQALEGTLSYQNDSTSGSTFTLKLRAKKAEGPPLSHDSQTTPPHELHGHLLIVEDNRINNLVLQETLKDIQPSFQIDTVFNGEQAITHCQKNSYDLILMDYQLPKMNGAEALKQIKVLEKHPHTPIIAVTASASTADEKRCYELGFDHFLSKPLEEIELLKILNQYLRRPPSKKDRSEKYKYWDPQSCLNQMGKKHSVLVNVIEMALQDIPTQQKKITDPKLSEGAKHEWIHHLEGTLKTLHTKNILPLMEDLKSASLQDFPGVNAKVSTRLSYLQNELKLWLSRQ